MSTLPNHEKRPLVVIAAAILANGQSQQHAVHYIDAAEELVDAAAERWPDRDDSDVPDPPNPAESVR